MAVLMGLLFQNVLNGLSAGSVYALIAVGLVLIYRSSGVLHFAHGSFAMLATFVAYTLHQQGLGLVPSFLGATLVAFVLGAGTFRILLDRAREGGSHAVVMITIALFMVSEGAAGAVWGSDTKDFNHYFSEPGVVNVGSDVYLSEHNLWINVVTVAIVGLLALFFRFTRVGVAMRAVFDNETAAELMGVRVKRLHAVTWGIASALAAAAGLLLVPKVFLDPSMMFAPMLKAFAAAVLGGLSSIPGAIVGGWLLGVIETLAGAYISTEFQASIAFFIIIAVLALRPEGLLGRRKVTKV
ncbi:MAG: branched-chain amino acid ABC transporter permease [Deltaproteobacteria bacterium]